MIVSQDVTKGKAVPLRIADSAADGGDAMHRDAVHTRAGRSSSGCSIPD